MQRVIPLLFFFGASGVRLRAPRQSPVVLDEWDAGPARKLSLEELEREDYRDYATGKPRQSTPITVTET